MGNDTYLVRLLQTPLKSHRNDFDPVLEKALDLKSAIQICNTTSDGLQETVPT